MHDLPLLTTALTVALTCVGLFSAARLALPWRTLSRAGRTQVVLLAVLAVNTVHPLFTNAHLPGPAGLEPLEFLLPPLLWYTARQWLRPHNPRPRDLAHLLPALAMGTWGMVAPPDLRGVVASWVMLLILAVAYGWPTFRALASYRLELKNEVSTLEQLDPRWFQVLLLLLAVLFATYSIFLAVLLHAPDPLNYRPVLSLVLGCLTVVMSWYALGQPRRLPTVEPSPPVPREVSPAMVGLQARLAEFMVQKRPFLDPELTLGDLADALGTPRNALSHVLNAGLQRTFYDYVNEHRVDEVIRLMGDPARKNHKLLALALDAGFNSKATFNDVFKKKTGLTPSAYRKDREEVR